MRGRSNLKTSPKLTLPPACSGEGTVPHADTAVPHDRPPKRPKPDSSGRGLRSMDPGAVEVHVDADDEDAEADPVAFHAASQRSAIATGKKKHSRRRHKLPSDFDTYSDAFVTLLQSSQPRQPVPCALCQDAAVPAGCRVLQNVRCSPWGQWVYVQCG